MSKLTPWYPPEVKPVRVGVYECKTQLLSGWFRYWNGSRWEMGDVTPDRACALRHIDGFFIDQGQTWRGLTREAK